MKLTKKDEEGIQSYIKTRLQEKTSTRQTPSLPQDWTPPIAKSQLSPEDAKAVDRELKRIMRPDPPRE